MAGRDEATVKTPQTIHDTLLRHLREIKADYYAGMPGVTHDDMAAARRVLEVRRMLERTTGRAVTTTVSKEAIATLLGGSLR